jgi:nitroimidazol reductase NimA-like FMN-containing flavoprotein (pyridoxamine 5'-phosphate oxidase superfamily)
MSPADNTPVDRSPSDRSPSDRSPTDHTGLRVMGLDECLERLVAAPVGRFAFELDAEIAVLPVQHVTDGVDVCFRTAGDSKIEAALDHDRVAFEVDSFDAATRTGWSVLVQGTAVLVEDESEIKALESRAGRPWVRSLASGHRWIRIRSQSVTGRELA